MLAPQIHPRSGLDFQNGGEGGIRTPDTLPGMSAFEADRFNRSRTSPRGEDLLGMSRRWKTTRKNPTAAPILMISDAAAAAAASVAEETRSRLAVSI